jgi:predicted TIM-barrel fold metal-dependent hydrolase
MSDPIYVDANCAVGLRSRPHPGSLEGVDAVLAEARRCNIAKVLAYHALAKEWSPECGNDHLRPVLAEHAEVIGSWIAEPSVASSAEAADRFVDDVLARGFRVVRFCPDAAYHAFDLRDHRVRVLTQALADRRVPLLIDTTMPDWRGITELAAQAPALSVIVSGFGYRHGRALLSLLDTAANVVVESSTFVAHGAVEEIVAGYGAHRVVFGTNAPHYSMGAAVARIAFADLSDDDRCAVAGRTLLDLVGQVAA